MTRMNSYFDSLPEPKRFLTFFAFIALPIVVISSFSEVAGLGIALALIAARLWSRR